MKKAQRGALRPDFKIFHSLFYSTIAAMVKKEMKNDQF
jgi:hypothetical protein